MAQIIREEFDDEAKARYRAIDWRSRESRVGFMRWLARRRGAVPVSELPRDHPVRRQFEGDCWARNHGPAHWELLHRRALAPVADEAAELAWLKGEYAAGIKCDHCRKHWGELLEKYPPDFAHYFESTWAWHEELNRELGKPPMPLDAARRRWSQPP